MARVPWSTLIAAGLGTAAAVRALMRPHRTLTLAGYVRGCAADSSCDPSMLIDAAGAPVFSPVAGQVLSADQGWVVVKPDLDDVVLSYAWSPGADSSSLQVSSGQAVHAGQTLAVGGLFRFSVLQVVRDASGTHLGAPFEPASWLAVRGLKISAKSAEPQLWCEGGRTLTVPQGVAKCGIDLPSPGPLSLLPVSVSLR